MLELNSPNGQNYLVLDAASGNLAFTEEQGGTGEEKKFSVKEGDSSNAYIFKDYLATKGMASPIGFFGQSLFYSHVTFHQGLYYCFVNEYDLKSGKESPVLLPFFRSKSKFQSGCISNDGQYMILSLVSNNTYGVEDLYLSKKDRNGEWSSVKNLGSIINTEYQEITPFLAADNRTLFFATNGRGGEGSYDIFSTERLDDSWRNWSEPKNLGSQINTSGAETSFAFRDGEDWAYFVSSQDSDGYGDIMRIKMQEDIDEDTTQVVQTLGEVIAERVMLKILDSRSKELIVAELIFDEDQVYVPEGVFVLDSVHLNSARMEVKSPGYLPRMIPMDDELRIGINEITLERVEAGETITLSNVLFQRGTPNLISGSEQELDLVVEMMNDNPDVKILLKGHTDNTGDPVKNVQLSEERVKSVKAYIVSQGISAYRVRGRGYGGKQPVASNASEETRKLNRRVEFEVIED